MSLVSFSRFCFYWVWLIVTLLAVLPQEQVLLTTGWDKANHALAFFVLLGLLDRAYPSANLWLGKVMPLLAYGLAIELVQSQISGRFASSFDVFGDAVGLAMYLLLRPILINKIPF